MKSSLINSLIIISFIFSVFACRKNSPGPPKPPVPPPGDTGLYYQAHALCDYNLNEFVLTTSGWTKVFEDNFDADLSKWNVWRGGAYNMELQHYQESNLVLGNGSLQIISKKERVTGATTPIDQTPKTFNYTSGRIESKSTFSANTSTPKVRMMARIKLPSGYGMVPVFLSTGNNWPTEGEIFLLSASGNQPTKYQTNYLYGPVPNNNSVRNSFGYITANEDLTSCYHVYEMEWSKNALTSFLDGNLVEQKTAGGYIPDLFGKQHRLIIFLAVSSDLINRAQIQPGTMYLDWVKVFTSK